jgi:pimeloyl-ACP methyl ester carboxylesterase
MDFIRGTGPFEELDKAQEEVRDRPWFTAVHRCDRALFYAARPNVGESTEPYWEKVHCPVLVIYGDKDVSSGPPEPLVAIIRRGLDKAGNKDITVRIFEDANHSLCRAKTGGPKEARERAKSRPKGAGPDLVPGYLDAMTDWLTVRCAPDNSKSP